MVSPAVGGTKGGAWVIFSWLLDASPYVPRGECGDWPPWMQWAWIAVNVVIAASYLVLPAGLVWLWRRRPDLPKPWMLLAFAAFITSCGLGHLWADVVVFWWPAYRFFLLWHAQTAIVSFATAVLLPRTLRYVATLPSPEEYARAIADRQILLNAATARAARLTVAADKMRQEFDDLKYRVVTEERFEHMRHLLHDLRGTGW